MATPLMKACIIGSGNWGSAIARIMGRTVVAHPTVFDQSVNMWVFEEEVNGKKLSEIINTQHENVKYLPGHKLPENIVGYSYTFEIAVPDLVESVANADVLVFVVPHQFVKRICSTIKGKLKAQAIAISLIKGLDVRDDGGIKLISKVISESLGIETAVLMGANLADEVAGCINPSLHVPLKKLFHSANFRITVVHDAHTVEVCGALKNVVACAAGFSDGLGMGDNTKAAVIRLGLMEMTKFVEFFYPGSKMQTFFESCGIADLITTCYGGRNRKCAEAFVKTGKSMEELEVELLGGQRLQGPATALEVYSMLDAHKQLETYPLFVAVHRICQGKMKPASLIDMLRDHPEHL